MCKHKNLKNPEVNQTVTVTHITKAEMIDEISLLT